MQRFFDTKGELLVSLGCNQKITWRLWNKAFVTLLDDTSSVVQVVDERGNVMDLQDLDFSRPADWWIYDPAYSHTKLVPALVLDANSEKFVVTTKLYSSEEEAIKEHGSSFLKLVFTKQS